MTLFGRYPAAWLSAITAVLAVVTNLPGSPLSGETAAWVVTIASALFTAYEAWTIRPVTVPMLTGAIRTTIAAVVLFGVPVSNELSGAIVAAVAMVFGLLVHANGTPAADPAPGFLVASERRSGLRGT
jgi:hypothetical protein